MAVRAPGSGVGPGNARLRATREAGASDAAASRFLLSLHVLGRARRLYQKDHPKIEESLVAAEHSLHEALAMGGSLAVSVERGQLLFRGRALTDSRGEMKTLADDLLRRGISALAFERDTHSGELLSFAELFENPPAPDPAGQKDSAALWNEWLAKRRIARIRISPPCAKRSPIWRVPRDCESSRWRLW